MTNTAVHLVSPKRPSRASPRSPKLRAFALPFFLPLPVNVSVQDLFGNMTVADLADLVVSKPSNALKPRVTATAIDWLAESALGITPIIASMYTCSIERVGLFLVLMVYECI